MYVIGTGVDKKTTMMLNLPQPRLRSLDFRRRRRTTPTKNTTWTFALLLLSSLIALSRSSGSGGLPGGARAALVAAASPVFLPDDDGSRTSNFQGKHRRLLPASMPPPATKPEEEAAGTGTTTEAEEDEIIPIDDPLIEYDDVDAIAPEDPLAEEDSSSMPLPAVEGEETTTNDDPQAELDKVEEVALERSVSTTKENNGEVAASDGAEEEETDVQDAAAELIQEAADEDKKIEKEEEKANEEEESEPAPLKSSTTTEAAATTSSTTESEPDATTSSVSSRSAAAYPSSGRHRSAWVAHGAIGALVMGLLVPAAITSALMRDLIPTYWIYIHVCVNVMTFALTFFAVGIAFATMNGMGTAGEGHLKEMHHIMGLLLLLLVTFQTANGFLRPPREFLTDDAHDTTPGAVLRSKMNDRSLTARTLWYLVHGLAGLVVFALGTYQVRSGLGLFSVRYGTPDWGTAYLGYAGWVAACMLIGKLVMKWKERRARLSNTEMEMGREGRGKGTYDPENDLTVARFETV